MSIASQLSRIISAKSAIASAIVSKGVQVPSTTKIDGYASLIAQIQQGGPTPIYQSKTFTPTSAGSTILPDVGYDALSQVVVNGDADLVAGNIKSGVSIFGVVGTYQPTITLQNKTFTPTSAGSTISADDGYSGLSQVTVAGDANLVPSNIASGVSIFGVVGTHSGGGGNNDIGLYAMRSLTSIYDSTATVISASLFCSSQTHLTRVEFTEVTNITAYSTFYGCTALEYFSMPKLSKFNNAASSLYAGLHNCTALKTVYLPLLSNVETYQFYNATQLSSVVIEAAKSIGAYAFRFCSSIESISLPDCTSLGTNAFQNCIKLKSIDLPKVQRVSTQAFAGCTSLSEVKLSVCSQIYGTSVFANCNALAALYLYCSNVCTLSASNAFNNTPIAQGTGSIYVPASLLTNYKGATNWTYFSSRFVGM